MIKLKPGSMGRGSCGWLRLGTVVTMIGISLASIGCTEAGNEDVSRLPATIVQQDGQFILVADSSGARYIPNRIPLSYREDGLRVYASGRTTTAAAANEPLYIELTSLVARSRLDARTE